MRYEQMQASVWTQEVCQYPGHKSRGLAIRAGGGLTKAAMAAPSLEVTAAKETTRKMMMALMQRRKSWGARGSGVWGSLPGGFPS